MGEEPEAATPATASCMSLSPMLPCSQSTRTNWCQRALEGSSGRVGLLELPAYRSAGHSRLSYSKLAPDSRCAGHRLASSSRRGPTHIPADSRDSARCPSRLQHHKRPIDRSAILQPILQDMFRSEVLCSAHRCDLPWLYKRRTSRKCSLPSTSDIPTPPLRIREIAEMSASPEYPSSSRFPAREPPSQQASKPASPFIKHISNGDPSTPPLYLLPIHASPVRRYRTPPGRYLGREEGSRRPRLTSAGFRADLTCDSYRDIGV